MKRSLVALLAAGIGLVSACDMREPGRRYLIPEGYAGWICVTFGSDGDPLHPDAEGFDVIEIPKSGRLSTSTSGRVLAGGFRNEYYFYSASDKLRAAEHAIGGGATYKRPEWPEGRHTVFFWVGEGIQQTKGVGPNVAEEGPRCGPIPAPAPTTQ